MPIVGSYPYVLLLYMCLQHLCLENSLIDIGQPPAEHKMHSPNGASLTAT